MTGSTLILALVTASRLFELILSRRHEKRLRAKGAYEIGASHYPILVIFHMTWLAGLWLIAHNNVLVWLWLVPFLALQIARVWTIVSLGERWTTRIIIVPNEPLVTHGPYRFLRHPNYLIVAGEIAFLPLAFGLPFYALIFSLANAAVLAIRLTVEEQALRAMRRDSRDASSLAP